MITPTCTQHEWHAPGGEAFPYSLWGGDLPPEEKPAAVVVAIHGLSGAAIDFEPLGSHLARHRVVTLAPELRGQGNDPEESRRGDLEKIEDWFRDLSAFFLLVRSRYPDTPVYYYGESLGAALLIRFLAQALALEQPAGVVLASPVVAFKEKPSWWQETVFRVLLRLRPRHRVDVRKYTKREKDGPSKWVTRDEAHRNWFRDAPHRIEFFTMRFFKCVHDIITGCMAAAPQVRVPTLLVYAANDVFITTAQVEKFFERIGSSDKELQLFPESYHLLLHDFDKTQALERIEGWLLGRIEKASNLRAGALKR